MGLKFNPLSGQLDYTGSTAAPVAAPHYVQSFDNTTSWGTASGGEYSISISAGTHGLGTNVIATVYEQLSPTEFEEVFVYTTITSAGTVTIKVPETPDTRFTGKIIIV